MSQGFVRKRGKTWTSYLQYIDPATGKRRQKTKGGHRIKQDALDWLDERKAARREHRWTEPRKATVAQYLEDEWLPSISRRPTTMASYRDLITRYVVPRIGGLQLAQLTPAHVRDMAEGLLANGGRDGQPLSPRTVTYVLTILRLALKKAVKDGYLVRSPAADVPNPKPAPREVEAWTADEASAFLDAVEGDRLYALWLLALARGPRRGELCALRWSDVDLAAGRVSIARATVLVHNEPTQSEPKTKAGKRTIPLDADLVAALRAHRRRQIEERMAWGPSWTDTGLVFTREDGTAVPPRWLTDRFDQLVRDSGLRRITFHGMRHTAATAGLAAGIPTEYVSNWLGHSSVSITQEMYQHVTPSLSEDQAAKLTALVLGRRSAPRALTNR